MGNYYPSYYWVQSNNYPPAPDGRNQWLPWLIIFLLIVASFYTIYLYIQPDFVLKGGDCSKQFVVVHLLTAKSGRFFLGDFSADLAGKMYTKRLTSSVEEGETLDVVFKVSLAPGATYSADVYFRNENLGTFSCKVR